MTKIKRVYLYAFLFIGITLMLLNSCEKDDNINIIYGDIVTDIDNNEYTTVIINDQEWMAENLRTTKYNDGTNIPTGHTDEQWASLTTDAFAIYPHSQIDGLSTEAEVVKAYGLLYNWYAVDTGKLCPEGWRIPSDEDWSTMINYVATFVWSTINNSGGKLKNTRTEPDEHPRWKSPNSGATDKYGFSAFPGGKRSSYSSRYISKAQGFWWSSTRHGPQSARYILIQYDSAMAINLSENRADGYSIRCIRNID